MFLANPMQHSALFLSFIVVGMADIWFHSHAAISTEGGFC